MLLSGFLKCLIGWIYNIFIHHLSLIGLDSILAFQMNVYDIRITEVNFSDIARTGNPSRETKWGNSPVLSIYLGKVIGKIEKGVLNRVALKRGLLFVNDKILWSEKAAMCLPMGICKICIVQYVAKSIDHQLAGMTFHLR